jgi:kumamolisin
MLARSHIRRPLAATASLAARQVAQAYNYPLTLTGKGYTCGIIELGGGFGGADLPAYFGGLGLPTPHVTSVDVDGGVNKPDGPKGADGEVLLDIEVAGSIAPGAAFRVYFAANTDASFLAAIEQAVKDGCTVVSISWGGPESSWAAASLTSFDAAFLAARKAGCVVFVAAGDSGSHDGTSKPSVDFPASSPNVIGCGGTRLTLNGTARASEVTWDDSDTTSATGGGISKHFPGRQVPDVAGNADPDTGYQVRVDGSSYVIGGTSAVAPLYAGLALLLSEGIGAPIGTKVDFLNTLLTNPGVCFDVTSGDNGAYRAGPGRDDVTGLGVLDGGKLLAVLTDGIPDPAPLGSTPVTPAPTPVPTPVPSSAVTKTFPNGTATLDAWAASPHLSHNAALAADAWKTAT